MAGRNSLLWVELAGRNRVDVGAVLGGVGGKSVALGKT